METLEQNVKSLLKDFDSKMKVNHASKLTSPCVHGDLLPHMQILQANPLMEKEQMLFVYFFTNPSKLSQVVGELARRVDALAAAQKID